MNCAAASSVKMMKRLCALSLAAFAGVRAVPWPHLCSAPSELPASRCPAGASCCSNNFSTSHFGCCPWAEAVCCSSGLTCCPKGSKCVDRHVPGRPAWAVVTTCERSDGSVPGKATCKYGPPLDASATLKNVLIIGDSVSIGYTPFVASTLSEYALVQHAPWSGDGGAEETAYGVQCLDYFLQHPDGSAYAADAVLFNWGLHDGPRLGPSWPPNATLPGQEGVMSVYEVELRNITARLIRYASGLGAKLLWLSTSPLLASATDDRDVAELNRRAASVMRQAGVPMLDLHGAITAKCGEAPTLSCFNQTGCFSPHCNAKGYEWLAGSTIAPAIRKLIGKGSDAIHV